MRPALALGVLILSTLASAQDSGERSLFLSVAPQATIVVKEHPTGADMVQVTMLKSGYPEELLKQQLQSLGEHLGVPPRGLAMARRDLGSASRKLDFLTATFAVNGLIDRPRGIVRLEPIVKAFAGAPDPYTLTGLSVLFEGEPLKETMIGRYTLKDAVKVEAMPNLGASELPMGVEYRIQLLTQDPKKISIPETAGAEVPPPPVPPKPSAPNTVLVLVIGAVAALAAGVLVYLALLRRAPRPR